MGDASGPGIMPTVSLQSKDHEEILNIIDDLRSQGISRYIDLPQIVVCGDQSSGKSSVLEAISGLRFPTKDNLCTRFATELILRRGPTETANITIIPDPSRPDAEQKKLQAFRAPTTSIDNEFGSIIEAAEKAMGLDHTLKAFSRDTLRVELSGPKQPHLTLVDLPGLFHAGNKLQSENDAESVKSLVQSYMKKSRSIILAVVSAKNDYANQIVTKYARDFDPQGRRTLGIITKPDTLHAGSDSERAFVDLAENKDVHLSLGWHVLRNRDYDTRNSTAEQRDEAEMNFFERTVWSSLPPSHLGIASLKPRLSRVLKDQILVELPALMQDVERGIKDCEERLNRLGASRGTLQEQRMYLLRVSQNFSKLMTAAIQGNYADTFFASPSTAEGYSKRLRAVIVNLLTDFSKTMDTKGHAVTILEAEETNKVSTLPRTQEVLPKKCTRDKFISKVLQLMKRTRGCELPGTFNPLIVGELFFEHSAPWQGIAEDYKERILDAILKSLAMTLEHAADQATNYGILQNIINPGLDELKQDLEKKVAATLAHQQRGHPITFNHYLTDTIQKKRDEEWRKNLSQKLGAFFAHDMNSSFDTVSPRSFSMKSLLETLTARTQADMDRYACQEVIHCMESYYKVRE